MEYVILLAEERDGLVYQLCAPRVEPTVLDSVETIELEPTIIVRKALSA